MRTLTRKSDTRLSVLCALAGVFTVSIAESARAVTTGANGTHDPGRMAESDDKLYIWSTGGGGMVSSDGLAWSEGARLQFGSWVSTWGPSNQGMWAPDEIFFNGQYFLFYSVCTQHGSGTKGACGIGLWTTPTLDPAAASYKLMDRGMIIASTQSAPYSCFDPGPVVDTSGNLWLTWGGGAWVTRLDNTTGQVSPMNPATPGTHLLATTEGEGTYMHYHAPYYYLFWNTGGCCDGTASTYTIHVARSQTITGPYLGANGVGAGAGGAQVFYETNGDIHGPGQIGIDTVCGTEVFTYHYYPTAQSILGVNTISWGSDGWPVAGPQITAPLKPCGGAGSNGAPTGSVSAQDVDGGPATDTSSDAGATSSPDSAGSGDSSTTGTESTDDSGSPSGSASGSGASGGTGSGSSGAKTVVPDAGETSGSSGGAAGEAQSEPAGGKSSSCACALGHPSDWGRTGAPVFALVFVAAARRRRAKNSAIV
jgi:arabinan endo-1,5-alpha-L-arabinosidase